MLTRTGGYALHVTVAIAERSAGERAVSAAELAEALEIPGNYLSKILHSLAREGVLAAVRGRGGGFRLARRPAEIRLLDVVARFDDLGEERQCLLGRGTCQEVGACPAHREWREAIAPAFHFFETRTVADLMRTAPDGDRDDSAAG